MKQQKTANKNLLNNRTLFFEFRFDSSNKT